MKVPPEPLVRTLAGRYVIERELGAGGMATVYLAEDVKHHRQLSALVRLDDPPRDMILGAVGNGRFYFSIGEKESDIYLMDLVRR